MKSVGQLKNIRGKRVLVRVDFNVPVLKSSVHSRQFMVGDDTRIKAALPTIDFLRKKGAKVILMTHYARSRAKSEIRNPKSEKKFNLQPIVARLMGLLGKKVQIVESWEFGEIEDAIKKMKDGELLMLPNLRLHPGEEKNSSVFAKQLAGLSDFYVNEAFSASHRKHASVFGVPKLLPAYAGFHVMQEVEVLSKLLNKAVAPFVVLMGGAKLSDKVALIKVMVRHADVVLVGTALANTFLKAAGYGVGASLVDNKAVREAKKLLNSKKIILPEDVVIGNPKKPDDKVEVVNIPKDGKPYALCSSPYAIVDIGPRTILNFANYLKTARTLLWNGPVGMYEIKRFSHGTLALGRLFASRAKGKAYGVAGGGETIDAIKDTGMAHYIDFISTGGGAMLEFLAGKKLPGID